MCVSNCGGRVISELPNRNDMVNVWFPADSIAVGATMDTGVVVPVESCAPCSTPALSVRSDWPTFPVRVSSTAEQCRQADGPAPPAADDRATPEFARVAFDCRATDVTVGAPEPPSVARVVLARYVWSVTPPSVLNTIRTVTALFLRGIILEDRSAVVTFRTPFGPPIVWIIATVERNRPGAARLRTVLDLVLTVEIRTTVGTIAVREPSIVGLRVMYPEPTGRVELSFAGRTALWHFLELIEFPINRSPCVVKVEATLCWLRPNTLLPRVIESRCEN